MSIVAVVGLLFFAYGGFQIIRQWHYRTGTEKALWFIVVAGGGGWCLSELFQ